MKGIIRDLQNFSSRLIKPNMGKVIIPGLQKSGPTFKVALAICTHRDVKLEVFKVTRLLEACPDPKIQLAMQVGDALIDRSRSKIATVFLKDRDDDILWFLDDDIVTNSQDMTRMMWEMWKYDLDILGAPYVLKSESEKAFAIRTLEDQVDIPCGKGAEIQEVRYVSTGCMGIRRRVFEKMIEKEIVHLCHPETQKFYPFFCPMEYNLNGKWIYLSEDWAFCQRARELGFKVHCDFGTKLGHIGPKVYDFDDFFREPKIVKDGFNYNVRVEKE